MYWHSTHCEIHDKRFPVHPVQCCMNVQGFDMYVPHIFEMSVPAKMDQPHKIVSFAGLQEK